MRTILVIGKYFPPAFGGIETVTKQCVDSLALCHKVIVICYNTKNKTEIEYRGDLVIIRCAKVMSVFRQPISLAMVSAIATCRADLVHFHAPNFWAAALVALQKARLPLVITHHADVEGRRFIRFLVMPIYSHMLRRASSIIVSSIKNAKLSNDLACDERKIREIPFGLNPDVYVVRQRNGSLENGNRAAPVHFGFCGRLVWYKGLEVLLQAFRSLENARMSIVGDGPLRSEIESLAADLRLQDKIVFHGSVSEARKLELLQEFDVFVLPSTHITETFGISQMEAQMCGIPCITSALPTGVSDVIEDGRTGLLVEPGDAVDLNNAMRRMIVDPQFRASCGREARARATRMFSEAAFHDRFRNLVEEVLEGGRPEAVVPLSASRPGWRAIGPRRRLGTRRI